MSILKNTKHEHFVHLCAKGENPTQAYIQAGYTSNGARQSAERLLRNADICARVAEIRANIVEIATEKSGVALGSVLQELKALVHADPRKVFAENGDLLPVKDWPDEVAAMIASIEIEAVFEGRGKARKHVADVKKVKFWDKNSAIEKAMKHLGAFEQDNKQKAGVFEGMPHKEKKAALALIQEEMRKRGLTGNESIH